MLVLSWAISKLEWIQKFFLTLTLCLDWPDAGTNGSTINVKIVNSHSVEHIVNIIPRIPIWEWTDGFKNRKVLEEGDRFGIDLIRISWQKYSIIILTFDERNWSSLSLSLSLSLFVWRNFRLRNEWSVLRVIPTYTPTYLKLFRP